MVNKIQFTESDDSKSNGRRNKGKENNDKFRSPFDDDYEAPDPVELAKKIQQSKLQSEHKNKEKFENKATEIVSDDGGFIWTEDFFDQHRAYCLDYGLPLKTNEMSRGFYLKERLSETENKNLLTITEILFNSAIKNKLAFKFGLFAVGSSTYSESYYDDLKNFFKEQGLSNDDFITEVSWIYGDQFSDYENYETYKNYVLKENKSRAFDEQLTLASKEKFEKNRKTEQKEYQLKKRVGDILNNKGEDLDFVIVPDPEVYADTSVGKYTLENLSEFGFNVKRFSLENKLNIVEETSYLGDHDYRDFRTVGGKFERVKEIKDRYKTLRINFDEGRSFHFYFKPFLGVAWVRQEYINKGYFVQLIRRNNSNDLKAAINNGLETGIYENPFVLKYLKNEKLKNK